MDQSNSIVIDVLRKALDRVMLKCFLNIYGNVQKSLLHLYLNLYKNYLIDDVLIINGNVNAEQSSKCEKCEKLFSQPQICRGIQTGKCDICC